jgi:hypothetical protein
LRNLIFFQDGHIRYEWEMEGGILLWKYITRRLISQWQTR